VIVAFANLVDGLHQSASNHRRCKQWDPAIRAERKVVMKLICPSKGIGSLPGVLFRSGLQTWYGRNPLGVVSRSIRDQPK
ncbi:MAG TPA: hypothetical protein VJ023_16655, partial [Pyrinomonadaceae bacterium]|nr:hypothetical protein [Pyrinomonadaceae bacterium]